jgi:cytochrome c2
MVLWWRAPDREEISATPEVGEALYAVKRCSTCHAIAGVGGRIGCDLTRVARRRKKDWMARWLLDPQRVRPGTNMPNMGLKNDEARAIAEYLATRR